MHYISIIGGFVPLIFLAVPFVRRSRREGHDERLGLTPNLTPQAAEIALAALENAAPGLFQLRKVGIGYILSPRMRTALRMVDEVRSQRVFDLVDGTVDLRTIHVSQS